MKIHGCEIQDVSTSISIVVKEEMSEDGDESDKHLKARDRRYSCLILVDKCCGHSISLHPNLCLKSLAQL